MSEWAHGLLLKKIEAGGLAPSFFSQMHPFVTFHFAGDAGLDGISLSGES
jgi:hypothetical protein